jgi:glycosyltransferase involved in cell wall biosynthesis
MRICIAQNVNITEHLGLSTYLRNITEHLANLEENDIILLSQKGDNFYRPKSPRIKVHEIDAHLYTITGNLKYSISLYKKLKEIHQTKPFDIIHCIYPSSSLLGAVLFKRSTPSVKIIYDIRSPWIEMSIARGSINKWIAPIYKKLSYFSESLMSRYVDGFIFITEGLKKYYEKKVNLNTKLYDIIPSGIDVDFFKRRNAENIKEKYRINPDDIIIGYIGGISKTRDLDFIINALKKFTETKIKLMLVGDGDDKDRLEQISGQQEIQDRVIFTGSVTHKDAPDYISAFDIGICHLPDIPIFRYSFPMKILEYLACGIPVLASEIETHVYISQKLPGVYIYNTPENFVKQVEKISQKKMINTKLDGYRWEMICQRIMGLYEKAAKD